MQLMSVGRGKELRPESFFFEDAESFLEYSRPRPWDRCRVDHDTASVNTLFDMIFDATHHKRDARRKIGCVFAALARSFKTSLNGFGRSNGLCNRKTHSRINRNTVCG